MSLDRASSVTVEAAVWTLAVAAASAVAMVALASEFRLAYYLA